MHNRSIYLPHFKSDQRSEAANRHVTDLSLMHLRDTDNWLSNTTHSTGANYGPTNMWSRTTSQAGGRYRHVGGILSLEWTSRCLGLGVQNRILKVWRTPLILNFGIRRRFQDVIYAVRRLNGSPALKKRRKDNRLILLYKGLKGKASVPTDGLIPKTRRCRNQHSMAFQTPIANTDVYQGSFFPQTIRDWNAIPDSLISSAEDAEDCVALVRARD